MDTGINRLSEGKESNIDQHANTFSERFQHLAESLNAIHAALTSGTQDVTSLFEQSIQSRNEESSVTPAAEVPPQTLER